MGRFEAPAGTPVPSAPDGASLPTNEGMPPRGSQGPGKADRRLWEVGRIDPGCILHALICSGSGQGEYGRWVALASKSDLFITNTPIPFLNTIKAIPPSAKFLNSWIDPYSPKFDATDRNRHWLGL